MRYKFELLFFQHKIELELSAVKPTVELADTKIETREVQKMHRISMIYYK